MSTLDSLDNVKFSISKFIGPVILFVIGIFLYLKSVVPEELFQKDPNGGADLVFEHTQEKLFGYAGLFLIGVAIFWVLYIFNVIKSYLSLVTVLILIGLSWFILAKDYNIVKEEVLYQAKKEKCLRELKGRLNDMKLAESKYKQEIGKYTDNADTLVDFIKNGKLIAYEYAGLTPVRTITPAERTFLYGPKDKRPLDNNITDIEAKRLSMWADAPDSTKLEFKGYKRDTVYVSVFETVFKSDSYLKSRNKALILDFNPDSLFHIPYSDSLIKVQTGELPKGDLVISTLFIEAIHPDFNKDTLRIGDLNSNSLEDSWSRK